MLYLWGLEREDMSPRQQGWQALLEGDIAPKHLAGQWILDFTDFARLGYGADHEYRVWFRNLRPYLTKGYLPVTWWEQLYGQHIDYDRVTKLQHIDGETLTIPRYPDNPFIRRQ